MAGWWAGGNCDGSIDHRVDLDDVARLQYEIRIDADVSCVQPEETVSSNDRSFDAITSEFILCEFIRITDGPITLPFLGY